MPHLEAIFAVLFAGLILSATPGPSMLYVLSRSVGQSQAAGMASALGLGLGGIILAVATALGLAAIFANFPWLVVSLRYVGSGYLIWLGLTMIRDVYKADVGFALTPTVTQRSFGAIVLQGVLVELLNPKTVLFFALFLPPFVDMANGQSGADVTLQLLVLGVLVPLVAIPSDIFVAIMGGKMTRIIGENNAVRKSMAWIGGLFLIVIAMNLHLSFIG